MHHLYNSKKKKKKNRRKEKKNCNQMTRIGGFVDTSFLIIMTIVRPKQCNAIKIINPKTKYLHTVE